MYCSAKRITSLASALCAVAMSLAVTANAQIVGIENGNFDITGRTDDGFTSQVGAPWHQSTLDWNYHDFIWRTGGFGGNFSGNVFGSIDSRGYIYQNIGTYAGEPGGTLTGAALWQNDWEFGGATFSLYEAPSGTMGADGTWVADLAGASLLDSQTIPADFASRGDFSLDFDLSGATPGNEIFFGIDGFRTGGRDTYLDTLEFTAAQAAAVPEPASVAIWCLIGLVGTGFGIWRRLWVA